MQLSANAFPCGKAPGLMGAFVCGAPELKELLINRARSFIFTTAQPPHLARLLARIIDWLQSNEAEVARGHVQSLARELRLNLRAAGFNTGTSTTHIVPVIVGGEERALNLALHCREAGLDVRAIRPPSVPKDTSRLRVILQAGHTAEDVAELARVICTAEA